MKEQNIDRVRVDAERKGMELIEIDRQGISSGHAALYELIVPEQGVRVYPQGMGVEGATLNDVEEWLSCPWE